MKVVEGKYTLKNNNDFSIPILKNSERGTLPPFVFDFETLQAISCGVGIFD